MTVQCPKCQFDNPEETLFCGKCGTRISLSDDLSVKHTETLQAPREELTTGATFAGRYQIVEELGRGGMGKVYKAIDTEVKEKIALKLIKPEISMDEKTIARFQNELKLARKISHRNVCRMYDLNKEDGNYYITMEYVPGEDLKSMIRMSRQLSVATAVNVAKQVCEGLSEAHRIGVIHRDLKPSNIMIDKAGNVRIMDFGIARSLRTKGITGAGVMIGTPEYMSPEQVEGKEVDQRSDIYSLGIILYEMVTGRVPFDGDTPFTVGVKHKSEEPQDPKALNTQITDDLSSIILKCLEKEKTKRPQSVDELISDLSVIEKGVSAVFEAPPQTKPLTTPITGVPVGRSIAVLPFADLSAQKDQEYFCDGLADELISRLTNIESLRVPARTSTFSFKGKQVEIQDVGKKLHVDMVLEGSLRKAGNKLRITVQLVNVTDGYPLWSDKYERNEEDIFVLQDEISLAIVDKLKLKLLGGEKEKIVKRHTENPDAYDLYLKGIYFWNKRSSESMNKGMSFFRQALDKDPAYALAYASLADAFNTLGFWGWLVPKEAFPKARAFAEKALSIDDALAEAHNSLGFTYLHESWNWAAAEKEFKLALELNPNYAQAHAWYSHLLLSKGQVGRAIEEMRKALKLDPLSLHMRSILAEWLRIAGRLEEAEEEIKRVLDMDPSFGLAHYYLAYTYIQRKRYKKAVTSFQRAIELMGNLSWAIGWLGATYAIMGETRKAKEILKDLLELSKQRYVHPSSFAAIYGELGDLDKYYEWTGIARKERDPFLPLIKYWRTFTEGEKKVRSDPRFKELLKKIGLE
jgi:serine/threonine protein kinase